MSFDQFVRFLRALSAGKALDFAAVEEAMVKCGMPEHGATVNGEWEWEGRGREGGERDVEF